MARIFRAGAILMALGLVSTVAWAKAEITPQPKVAAVATAKPTVLATVVATHQPTPVAKPGTATAKVADPAAAKAATGTATASSDHKSAALASLLAVVPGIVVHGSGHMYAGAWMKGLGLFAIEGACVAVGYDSVRRGVDSYNAMNNAGSIPTDLSPVLTDAGVAFVTGMGFLWTWWDDMAGAGIAADQYNRRQDQASQVSELQMHLVPARGGALLALSSRF